MLVLSRNVGQKIIIDGNIVVQIMDVKGRQVRVSISAPKEVTVHREEIQKKVDAGIVHKKKIPSRYESIHTLSSDLIQ